MTGPDNDLDFMVDDPQLEDELPGMRMSVADPIVVVARRSPTWLPSGLLRTAIWPPG
jgi:hypothetical protein